MPLIRTTLLMAFMTALFMGVGWLLGGASGAVIALAVAAVMNLLTWWNSDKLVLRLHGAKPAEGTHSHLRDMTCLLYTSPSPRDLSTSRMPSSA